LIEAKSCVQVRGDKKALWGPAAELWFWQNFGEKAKKVDSHRRKRKLERKGNPCDGRGKRAVYM